MNLNNALRLAWIFSVSASRAKRSRGGKPVGLAKRPVTNIYFSIAAFTVAAVFAYLVGGKMEAAMVNSTAFQLSVFLPPFTVFISMVYSLMTEFSLSGETASTDMVNWLPVEAGDFVLGSSLTTIYFVSPMVSLLIGAALGLSLAAGSTGTGTLSALLGVLGCFLGAFVLEVVRGLMNRVSGAFSRVEGQGAVILRLVLSVSLIVTISLMFNLTTMIRVIGWFSASLEAIRFVPVFWLSMIVLNHATGDSAGVLAYSGLSGLFFAAAIYASVTVRRRYWAPSPVSLKFQPAKVTRRSPYDFLSIRSAEAVVVRKDLKGLLRRREMAYLLAVPLMVVLMGLVGASPGVFTDNAPPSITKIGLLFQFGLGVIVLAMQMSLNGIGQEQDGFMNLLAAPLDPSQLLRAKLTAAMIPVLPVFAVFTVVFSVVAEVSLGVVSAFVVVGLAVLTAVCAVELAVGARYANFQTAGRARFITMEGRLIGFLACMVSMSALGVPLALHLLWGRVTLPVACILVVAIAAGLVSGGFKAAQGELQKLYEYNY